MISAFLRAYWKQLFVLALVLALIAAINYYLDSLYESGRRAGIEETQVAWTAKYNKDVGILNKRIEDTEEASRRNADKSDKELTKASDKIAELTKSIAKQREKYDSYVYNNTGAIVCKAPDAVYLGPEFSAEWNRLNGEILK